LRTVGIGIIGCGGIGQLHLKNLKKIDSARVVAACDVNPSTLESFGKEAELPKKSRYKDYRRLLKRSDVEAVIVSLPNRLHPEVTVEAFEAGKHVYCEKPMAVNLSEAKRMVEAAEKSGMKLQIGLQYRLRGDSQVFKLHVDNGELGEIYYAKCGYLRRSGIPGWGSWFTRKKDAGAGPIFDLGVHILDLTLWLMSNFKPATAYASSYAKFGPKKKGLGRWGKPEPEGIFDVEDLSTALLKMEDGASIFFEASWASHIAKPSFYSTLMGNKAGLDFESASIYTTEHEGYVDRKLYFEEKDAHLAGMNHFVDCILKDEEPLTRPEEMLGLQRALDMILKSSMENRAVSASEV